MSSWWVMIIHDNSLRARNTEIFSNLLAKTFILSVDYILGDNPRATSYMVKYGAKYPRPVHQRVSSIVSNKEDSTFLSCKGGYSILFDC